MLGRVRAAATGLLRHIRWLDRPLSVSDRALIDYWDRIAAEPHAGRHRAGPPVRRPPVRLRRI